ncbi:MAG TPA: YceI family protein [Nitrospirota bacterium]|nr:YceI family protein [Nitrospirota bacterium]
MAKWIIDQDHSCAAFAIRHMALAHVRGQFSSMRGTIHFDPAERSRVSVDVEIDVGSVNTGIKKRDEHLLTGDFFDEGKYPTIGFTSSSVVFLGSNRCRISGSLTMHGVTKQVTFEGEYAGPRKNPYGDETTVGFSGTTTVNREDFGIMWGSELMEGGGLVAGREVQIFLDVEADLAE